MVYVLARMGIRAHFAETTAIRNVVGLTFMVPMACRSGITGMSGVFPNYCGVDRE